MSMLGFFDWMFMGECVYCVFLDVYLLLMDVCYVGGCVSFEIYFYVIICVMLGKVVVLVK